MAKKNRNKKRVNLAPHELMQREHFKSIQRNVASVDLEPWDEEITDSVTPIPAPEPVELLQPKQPKPVKAKPSRPKPAETLLLTVPELCGLLNCSRSTVVRMQDRGELPGRVYIGSAVRYHRETIETWLRDMAIREMAIGKN